MSQPTTPSSATAFVRPWSSADGPPSAPLPDSPRTEPGPSRVPGSYRSHVGCSMCTLVNYPARQEGLGIGREVHRDDSVTVHEADEKARAASGGHLVVVLNNHAESIYDLGPADVPLLTHIGSLVSLLPSSSHKRTRVGFITQFRDTFFPSGHLHAHILSGPLDKASFWRRSGPYGPLSWYELEDLIAEIRESTSNNRIKSGYGDARRQAPITKVPDAGSLSGKPNVPTEDMGDFSPVSLQEPSFAPQIERSSSSAGLLRPTDDGDLGSGLDKGKGRAVDL